MVVLNSDVASGARLGAYLGIFQDLVGFSGNIFLVNYFSGALFLLVKSYFYEMHYIADIYLDFMDFIIEMLISLEIIIIRFFETVVTVRKYQKTMIFNVFCHDN